MRTRTAALLVAAVSLTGTGLGGLAVPSAHADASHAWQAAKGVLPDKARAVGGANLQAIHKSSLFAQFYPLLIAKQPDVQKALDLVKATCKIDPLDAVDGVVLAFDEDQKHGIFFLSLHNLTQDKMLSCLQAVAVAKGEKATVTIKKDGNITSLTPTGKDTIYYGWLGSDVVAITTDANDKASLQSWIGGKGALAKSDLGKPLAKVDTGTALWGAVLKTADPGIGITMKGGYGSVAIATGNVTADLRVLTSNAADATKASTMINSQLGSVLPSLPPQFAGMAKSLKITAVADELSVKFAATEKDIGGLIGMALGAAGGSAP